MGLFRVPDALLPPPLEVIDEWAERVIVLPRGVSGMPGPLDLDMTPYLREPLRAAGDPDVSDVVLCTSSQVAKTTYLMIVALHQLATDPWNMLWVMPTEDDAIELNLERLQPIIRESPDLSALVHGVRGELVRDAIRLNGVTITFRGANSPAGLSSKPGKILIADEVDKWPLWTGREASPLSLLGERAKTFHDSKFLKTSTPTTPDGVIWRELVSSSNERYHVPCARCGTYQILRMGDGRSPGGLRWPEVDRPLRIVDERLAWYECIHCGGRIEDGDKAAMVRSGRWIPDGMRLVGDDLAGPAPPRSKRGFHLWAAYGLWAKSSFSYIAAQFLLAKEEPAKLQNFRNSWQGETWKITVNELKGQHLRDLVGEYYSGSPPPGPFVWSAGVDVQSYEGRSYFYVLVRAWSAGEESWLLRATIAESWEAVAAVLVNSEYRDTDGRVIRRGPIVIDSGYRPDEVYRQCEVLGAIAYKGIGRAQRHLTAKTLEVSPGTGRHIPFVAVDPSHFKAKIHRLIRERRDGSPVFRVPQDVDEEWYTHMLAEQQVRDVNKRTGRSETRWKTVSESAANHYLDCEVMAAVGAELLELQSLKAPLPDAPQKPRPQKTAPREDKNPNKVRLFS